MKKQRLRCAYTSRLILLVGLVVAAQSNATLLEQDVHRFASASCEAWHANNKPAEFLDRTVSIENAIIEARGIEIGQRFIYDFEDTSSIKLDVLESPGRPLQFVVEQLDQFQKPTLFMNLDTNCSLRIARNIVYENNIASRIEHLDKNLEPTGQRDELNPPIPAINPDQEQKAGPLVAIIDSGVNYTLPQIANNLARDSQGKILGYDFWEMDALPFDVQYSRSPFFIQRHGTRTASLLLREAPDVRLVPYRYPRSDVSRFKQLVEHAYELGVRIVGMPLGSNRYADWVDFADAAKARPEILFVASAGNNGREVELAPVYPAAMEIDNMIVVTSADDYLRPAERTNWGRMSVDYLIPAEEITLLNFNGEEITASGSSYAVARITAMAARIKQQHPDWGTDKLKQEIQSRSIKSDTGKYVRIGYIGDPLSDVATIDSTTLSAIKLKEKDEATHRFPLHIFVLDERWQLEMIKPALKEAEGVLSQCQIGLDDIQIEVLSTSDHLKDLSTGTAKTLFDNLQPRYASLLFARDTKMQIKFDAEAFGEGNTANRVWLRDTVWLTYGIQDLGKAIAHELFHVLTNSGEHLNTEGNLMNERTSLENAKLTMKQCELAISTATRNNLLIQLH